MRPALRAMGWRGVALLLAAAASFATVDGDNLRSHRLGWVMLAIALGATFYTLAGQRLARHPARFALMVCCALATASAVVLLLHPTPGTGLVLALVCAGGLILLGFGGVAEVPPAGTPSRPGDRDRSGDAPRPFAARRPAAPPPPPGGPPPSPLLGMLAAAIHGDVSPGDFEQTVYASPEMEAELGPADYHALLAFDYRGRDAGHELGKLLEAMYERRRPGMLLRDRVRVLAERLCDGTADPASAVGELALHWYRGREWIPSVFVSIDSDLGEIPTPDEYRLWDAEVVRARHAEWEALRETLRADAVEAAQTLLQALDATDE